MWVLAQQLPAVPPGFPFERPITIGVVGVICYYVIRYLVGQVDKKDQRNEQQTAQFIATMEKFGGLAGEAQRLQEITAKSLDSNTAALRELRDVVSRDLERRHH